MMQAAGLEVLALLGIVAQQADGSIAAQVEQDRCSVAEIATVVRQSERAIRLVGIFAAVLQHIGDGLGPQTDATALVTAHVDHGTGTFGFDAPECELQLRTALAARRAENISRQTAGMNA